MRLVWSNPFMQSDPSLKTVKDTKISVLRDDKCNRSPHPLAESIGRSMPHPESIKRSPSWIPQRMISALDHFLCRWSRGVQNLRSEPDNSQIPLDDNRSVY